MDVEWLILADAAEVTGGKLYMMGGGWDRLNVGSGFPLRRSMAVAVAVRVPWAQTNETHALEIDLADQDGKSIASVNGEFEVGRPPRVPPGQDQRIQMAMAFNWNIEGPGTFSVSATIDGEAEAGKTFPFNVVDMRSREIRRSAS